jgi:hypothetical protein
MVTVYLIKYHAMNTYGEWRYSSTIRVLGTRWRSVVSVTPWAFTLGERALGTR